MTATLHLAIDASYPGFALALDEQIPLAGVTAVFGPSGGGKTTLLRAVAGFERPRAGRIAIGGEVWFDSGERIDIPAHRRGAGLMFQDARLFPHLTVEGNLDYADKRSAGAGNGVGKGAVVDALGLAPLLLRRTDALSGGERQRAALARTLLARPKLLLLDEPLAALDRMRKVESLAFIEAALKRFGVPALYVSHDIEEVARLADRTLVLAEGRAQALGPTADILERLDLQDVTGKFEAGVLIEARIVSHDARLKLTHADIGGAAISMPMIDRLAPGDRVRLRVRARDVALATKRPEGLSIRNVLPGTLARLVVEEDTAFAEAFVDLGAAHLRARVTRAAAEELQLAEGMAVFALVKSVSFDRRLV